MSFELTLRKFCLNSSNNANKMVNFIFATNSPLNNNTNYQQRRPIFTCQPPVQNIKSSLKLAKLMSINEQQQRTHKTDESTLKEMFENVISQTPKSQKTIKISIEGNIASGKTSIIEQLRKSTDYKIKLVKEPADIWQNLNGSNLLELMYKDPNKWAFAFHSLVQLTLLESHLEMNSHNENEPKKENGLDLRIMERSIYSAKYCFVENLYKCNILKPAEYDILDKWFNWMIQNHDCGLNLIFYLRTKPETCFERLLERGRSEEVTAITIEYLQNLHNLHEEWLNSTQRKSLLYKPPSIIVIDGDNSIDNVYSTITEKIKCSL